MNSHVLLHALDWLRHNLGIISIGAVIGAIAVGVLQYLLRRVLSLVPSWRWHTATADLPPSVETIHSRWLAKLPRADVRDMPTGYGDWSLVVSGLDIPRSSCTDIPELLRQPRDTSICVHVFGDPGAGKTIACYRAIVDTVQKHGMRCLWLRESYRSEVWSHLQRFARYYARPFLILADDPFQFPESADAIRDQIAFLLQDTTVALLLTSHRSVSRLRAPNFVQIPVGPPTAREQSELASRFAQYGLTTSSRPAPSTAKTFLALVLELTRGDAYLEEVRHDAEQLRLSDNSAYRAYLLVCCAHQYGYALPTEFLHLLQYQRSGATQGLIFQSLGSPSALVSAHPLVAKTVVDNCGRLPCDDFQKLVEKLALRRRGPLGLATEYAELVASISVRLQRSPPWSACLQDPELVANFEDLAAGSASVAEALSWRDYFESIRNVDAARQAIELVVSLTPTSDHEVARQLRVLNDLRRPTLLEEKYQRALDWTQSHPDDILVRSCLLSLAGSVRYTPRSTVFDSALVWLTSHPYNETFRAQLARFLQDNNKNLSAQQISLGLEDMLTALDTRPGGSLLRDKALDLVAWAAERHSLESIPLNAIDRLYTSTIDYLRDHPNDGQVARQFIHFCGRVLPITSALKAVSQLPGLTDDDGTRHHKIFKDIILDHATTSETDTFAKATIDWLRGKPNLGPEQVRLLCGDLARTARRMASEAYALDIFQFLTELTSDNSNAFLVSVEHLRYLAKKTDVTSSLTRQARQLADSAENYLSPAHIRAHLRLAKLLQSFGLLDEAQRCFENLFASNILRNPQWEWRAHYQFAQLLQLSGDHCAAVEHYQDSIIGMRDRVQARVSLADALQRCHASKSTDHRCHEALRELLIARDDERPAHRPAVARALGQHFLRVGIPEYAAEEFENALAWREDAATYDSLAQAQDLLGYSSSADDSRRAAEKLRQCWLPVVGTISAARDMATLRLREFRAELESATNFAFRAYSSESSAEQGWYHKQVVMAAQRLGYFADLRQYASWNRISRLGQPTLTLLLSYHCMGRPSDGQIAVVPIGFTMPFQAQISVLSEPYVFDTPRADKESHGDFLDWIYKLESAALDWFTAQKGPASSWRAIGGSTEA